MHLHSLPPRIIGLAGEKGSGKNLLAYFIRRTDSDFQIGAFANLLKHITANVFKMHPADFHVQELKERPLEQPVNMDEYLPEMVRLLGVEIEPRGEVATTPRELLQYFGTEYVRSLYPDFWVRETMANIFEDSVLADVRFANEAEAIRNRGGVVVRIVRDGKVTENPEHSSEAIDFPVDAVFYARSGDFATFRALAAATLDLVNAPRAVVSVQHFRRLRDLGVTNTGEPMVIDGEFQKVS